MNLKDEILKLTNVAPIVKDDQELSDDDTNARVNSYKTEYDSELLDQTKSSRRFRSFIDLSEINKSYSGKVTSRAKLDNNDKAASDDDEKEDEEDDDDGDNDDDDEEDDDDNEDDDVDDEYSDENDEEDETEHSNTKSKSSEKISDNNFTFMHEDDNKNKGKLIKNQLNLWEVLLENRIKLQNLITNINQYPYYDELNSFIQNSDDSLKAIIETSNLNFPKFREYPHVIKNNIVVDNELSKSLFDELHDLYDKYNKHAHSNDINYKEDDSENDSENDSDIEDDNKEGNKRKKTNNNEEKKVKKFKFDEIESYLESEYNNFIKERNAVLQKWHEKTNIFSVKSLQAFEKPILQQIEHLIMDKNRITKRTQLKRTIYNRITNKNETENENKDTNSKDYDQEIFDDYDFYQQLLRELINRKSSNLSDPLSLSKRSIELQKLNSMKKKKVDTKASKGRKLKFDVHKSLVNFMAPIYNEKMSENGKNDLFSALFENHTTFAVH